MSCPSATKTKQENFELKLEQGNMNFQHILETLERQRVGQDPGGSEVLPKDQLRQDCVCAQEQFVVKAPQFSDEKCEGAMKQVKEYRRGLRQMMADGDFFRGTFFRVQRVQCDVTPCMAFDLQVLAERLLHKNPVNRKHCKL